MRKIQHSAICVIFACLSICVWLVSGVAYAEGPARRTKGIIVPKSAVLIDVKKDKDGQQYGTAALAIENPAPYPIILHTSLKDAPGDTEPEELLVADPVVALVKPGHSQVVHFMLIEGAQLKTEWMKRVEFEGLPDRSRSNAKNAVGVNIRYDLPVLLRPADLPVEHEPWKRLSWALNGDVLRVLNPSPYVVRLGQGITLMPAKIDMQLPRNYILPHEQIDLRVAHLPTSDGARAVRLSARSSYGYKVRDYDAPLRVKTAEPPAPASH